MWNCDPKLNHEERRKEMLKHVSTIYIPDRGSMMLSTENAIKTNWNIGDKRPARQACQIAKSGSFLVNESYNLSNTFRQLAPVRIEDDKKQWNSNANPVFVVKLASSIS